LPIKRSAYKELRKAKKRHAVNMARASELKTLTKRFLKSVQEKNLEEAGTNFRQLISKIDKAAVKGFIHKNNASRRKMRLAKMLKRLKQGTT
jgi:small subunit ribosomal protein S20